MAKQEGYWCCWPSSSRRFPTFAIIVFVLGTLWLLNELNVIATGIPWLPVILIVISLGWIVDHYSRK